MNFRLEAVDPTSADKLQVTLEAARDVWIRTTPQETDESIPDLDAAIANSHNEARVAPTRARARAIAEHSEKLDAVHTDCLRLMNAGIAAAVALASKMDDVPVRASVFGHVKTIARDGIYERVSVTVDHAKHG
jgi:hypothetical protein